MPPIRESRPLKAPYRSSATMLAAVIAANIGKKGATSEAVTKAAFRAMAAITPPKVISVIRTG